MKPRSGKSVTFSESSSLFLVANLAAGPLKPRIWFTRSELDSFEVNARVDTHAVRQLIRSHRTPGASDILGMEKFLTDELTREYTARQAKRTNAVLDEADFQRLVCAGDPQGHSDPFSDKNVARLAAVAAEGSRWAMERARAAALFLELDQEDEREQRLDRQRQAEEPLKLKNERQRRCLEWQRQAEESLVLKKAEESLELHHSEESLELHQSEESLELKKDVRSRARGTDRSPVDSLPSVERGRRSSPQGTARTRSRIGSSSVMEEVLELRRQLEQQLQAEESLELEKDVRSQAQGAHRPLVDSVPNAERGRRSSPRETARTRSRIVSTSVVEVSPSFAEVPPSLMESQTSVWL